MRSKWKCTLRSLNVGFIKEDKKKDSNNTILVDALGFHVACTERYEKKKKKTFALVLFTKKNKK